MSRRERRAPREAAPTPTDTLPAPSGELTGLSPVKSTLDRQTGASGVLSTYTVDMTTLAGGSPLGAPFFGRAEAMA
jgi:hypothetical protein